jgi:hypothetical protein
MDNLDEIIKELGHLTDNPSEATRVLSENGHTLVDTQEKYPNSLPLLPLRNTLLFPGVIAPINIGREKSEESRKKEMDTKLKKFIKKYGSILQYDLNYNLIKEWVMLPSQISKEIKKDPSQFVRTLKVENKKCNGFYWKYKITQN